MLKSDLGSRDLRVFNAVAEVLLWTGEDRAADAIYAMSETDQGKGSGSLADGWNTAFND